MSESNENQRTIKMRMNLENTDSTLNNNTVNINIISLSLKREYRIKMYNTHLERMNGVQVFQEIMISAWLRKKV